MTKAERDKLSIEDLVKDASREEKEAALRNSNDLSGKYANVDGEIEEYQDLLWELTQFREEFARRVKIPPRLKRPGFSQGDGKITLANNSTISVGFTNADDGYAKRKQKEIGFELFWRVKDKEYQLKRRFMFWRVGDFFFYYKAARKGVPEFAIYPDTVILGQRMIYTNCVVPITKIKVKVLGKSDIKNENFYVSTKEIKRMPYYQFLNEQYYDYYTQKRTGKTERSLEYAKSRCVKRLNEMLIGECSLFFSEADSNVNEREYVFYKVPTLKNDSIDKVNFNRMTEFEHSRNVDRDTLICKTKSDYKRVDWFFCLLPEYKLREVFNPDATENEFIWNNAQRMLLGINNCSGNPLSVKAAMRVEQSYRTKQFGVVKYFLYVGSNAKRTECNTQVTKRKFLENTRRKKRER